MLVVARSLFAIVVRSLSLPSSLCLPPPDARRRELSLCRRRLLPPPSRARSASLLCHEHCLPPSNAHQRNEAENQLRRIRGVDDVREFNDLILASDESKKIENPLRNLRQRKYMPQLCMAILIPFFQQFTGINVIMFYAPVLFNTIGFGGGRLSETRTGRRMKLVNGAKLKPQFKFRQKPMSWRT
ncbi:hypothetical protein ACLB2K_047319 [Fragaria x ananassa]